MRGSILTLILVAPFVVAQPSAKTKLLLELELAKPPVAAKVAPLTVEQAKTYMRERPGRAVLVRVGGMDCSTLCDPARDAMRTCHADAMWGDATPRMLMIAGDVVEIGAVRLFKTWTTVPSLAEVKKEAANAEAWSDRERARVRPVAPAPAVAPALDWLVYATVPRYVPPIAMAVRPMAPVYAPPLVAVPSFASPRALSVCRT